jgi:DNA invertase Pin-like site-specific DNA recombinase
MKVIGYVRVSTQDQATEGISLDAQRDRIRKWTELNDGDLIAIYEDAGISGSSTKGRPGLEQALTAAVRGTALVSYSISRLARSTRDMLDIADRLERQGADLVSLSEKIDTTTAAGRMVFRMLAVLAEFERDQISERTKMALRVLKAKGVKLGSPAPARGGAVTAAKRIMEATRRDAPLLVAAGTGSLAERAARLNAAGHRTAHGKQFTAKTLSRMTRRA